jgi:hypothetical protein
MIMPTILTHLAKRYHLLNRQQTGSRPKQAAVNMTMFLVTKGDQVNSKYLITFTLCIDLNGAFDIVCKQRLLHTLYRMRHYLNVIWWVDSKRLDSLSFNNDTEPITLIRTGIPLGSPILLIIYLILLPLLFIQLCQTNCKITCQS